MRILPALVGVIVLGSMVSAAYAQSSRSRQPQRPSVIIINPNPRGLTTPAPRPYHPSEVAPPMPPPSPLPPMAPRSGGN